MKNMFKMSQVFNQNIKDWDVENVKSHHAFSKGSLLKNAYNPFKK